MGPTHASSTTNYNPIKDVLPSRHNSAIIDLTHLRLFLLRRCWVQSDQAGFEIIEQAWLAPVNKKTLVGFSVCTKLWIPRIMPENKAFVSSLSQSDLQKYNALQNNRSRFKSATVLQSCWIWWENLRFTLNGVHWSTTRDCQNGSEKGGGSSSTIRAWTLHVHDGDIRCTDSTFTS